jgi:hypothetical protein
MLKTYTTAVLLTMMASLSAQVADRTETNCEGESRSVYQVGEEGKPLLVASKGFDCSICQGQADDVALYAAQNAGVVEVWGAMTNVYSSNLPTCTQVENWSQTYNWEEVFAFADAEEYWLEFGTPRYYVIHPMSHKIVYEGSSFSTAGATALSLTTTSVDEEGQLEMNIYHDGEALNLLSSDSETWNFEVFNLVGQLVHSQIIRTQAGERIRIPFEGNRGIYIASFRSGDRSISRKVYLND